MENPSRTQIGRGVNTHFAGGLRTQIAVGSVYAHAVGGGEAAANHIPVHTSKGNLCTEAPGKVCNRALSGTVKSRGAQKGFL